MFIYDLMSCFDYYVMLYHILPRIEFEIIYLLHLIKSVARQAWHINSKINQLPKYQEMGFFPLWMIPRKTFQELLRSKTKMSRSINDSFGGRSQRMVTKVYAGDWQATYWFSLLICCLSVSSYNLTWRFAFQLNLSLVEHVGLVPQKTEVAYLKLFLCIVVKKTFQVTSSYFVACRHLRDDDFTICPTHRCWVESWFQ